VLFVTRDDEKLMKRLRYKRSGMPLREGKRKCGGTSEGSGANK
jgi:hypothetical protein